MTRIHIDRIDDALVAEIHYLTASPRGRTEVARLPIVRASVGPLADELDAIVACSDLQGVVAGEGHEAELLGIEVAYTLAGLADSGVLPPAARTGVILAGDLYSVPAANERGGFGGVAEVWRAFAEQFAWVVGVAGNHDDVSELADLDGHGERVHLLDGNVIEVDGFRIGGVGGIIGAVHKRGRRAEDAQLAMIRRVLDAEPDVLVLHEGPDGDGLQRGNPSIGALVEAHGASLTICGHVHWPAPLASHARGQVLNVDTRVVVMTAR